MTKLAAVESNQEPVANEKKQVRRVDFILQGKGGVGKSLIACLLAQYLKSQSSDVKCLDTDPVNQTFSNYKELGAEYIPILVGSKIDERQFDGMMEQILTAESGSFVIDNGASTFIPLTSYMAENSVVQVLEEAGYEVYFHTVVTGGQAIIDTMSGFKALAEMTNSKNIIVWLNEYFGSVEYNGKTFIEMKAFKEMEDCVRGIVVLHKRNPDTFGKDFDEMTKRKLVFSQAIADPAFSLMAKQRLKTVQKDVFAQIEKIGF